jgi:hypothetical protein
MCALGTLCSKATVVTDALVEAVAQVESAGGRFVVGDGGRANGAWQMHEAAWEDTTAFRKRKGLPVWDYSYAPNSEVAKTYARDYLLILERQLLSAMGPNITAELIYAAYNVGFSRFQSRGFRIERTPSSTQAACARLAQLIISIESAAKQNLAVAAVQ